VPDVRSAGARSKLVAIVARLKKHYGAQPRPPATDAFGLYLWDRVGYLVDDDRRRVAFGRLEREIGLTPAAILAASPAKLLAIATSGGIEGHKRAAHMRTAAEMVVGELDGDLDAVLGRPFPEARRALRKLPMVADAGAERIILFAGAHPVLTLESNGMRVLQRIGYGESHRDYTRSYKTVIAAAAPEAKQHIEWLAEAHLLLRHHGKDVCKTSAPLCGVCIVRADCAFGSRTATTRL
jgi:endonuclease III